MDTNDDDASQDAPIGRIEFDERGNAVWRPYTDARGEDTVRTLLHSDNLAVSEPDAVPVPGLRPAESGFDPYSSGLVVRSEPRRRPTDLRALSEAIKAARRTR